MILFEGNFIVANFENSVLVIDRAFNFNILGVAPVFKRKEAEKGNSAMIEGDLKGLILHIVLMGILPGTLTSGILFSLLGASGLKLDLHLSAVCPSLLQLLQVGRLSANRGFSLKHSAAR